MQSPQKHTVIVSDVHLSQAHPVDDADPLWMRYRRSEYHPDADFEAFIGRLLERCGDDAIELVFNGDVFDFDAPVVADGTSVFDEFTVDDAGCTAQIERILEDHSRFVRAAARVLVRGHRLLFVSGNHDVELYWPGVRRALREAFVRAAEDLASEAGEEASIDRIELGERVRFRTWFHVTEDRIYLEHGSQYDMMNGVPDPMFPVAEDSSQIHPVCGKLAFKRAGARMGYFNPYCEDTFYMGGLGYLRHFFADYLLSKERHIIRTWLRASVATVTEILRHRRGAVVELSEASVARALDETGASPSAIQATHLLRVPSAERTMIPILRELWLDRVAFAALIALATAATLLLASAVATGIVAATLCVLFTVYEIVTPKPDVRTNDSAPPSVAKLFEIHGARALCMGHTHRPNGTWEADRFRGNSGAWCPAFTDRECTKPVLDGRPFLWLTSAGEDLWGGLHWFRGASITPDASARAARTSDA